MKILTILFCLSVTCFAGDTKKTGHRIRGHYPDKGFQEKVSPHGSPTAAPRYPYYPY